MSEERIILPPDPSRVMEGLRDTGYTFNTAMADIVDNSISAGATKVDVTINLLPNDEITIYIADNGCGMDNEGLMNAMTYGSRMRDDPKSLGKFGLGLKTASTAFCRSLSVLSKTEINGYNKYCWDIDHVSKVGEWELIKKDIDQDEVDLLEETTDGKAGTLVIWEKIDRVQGGKSSISKAYKRIVEDLKKHFAMVYQRYLDPDFKLCENLTIKVNGEPIEPWDPFCRNEEHTIIHSEFDQPVILRDGSQETFHVASYILPRPEQFSSLEAQKRARVSNTTAGIWVYREDRLIHFGDWLDLYVPEPHVSLLRVELSFSHKLDEALNIDIKKSKILLSEEIFNFLKTTYLPSPRNQAIDIYNSAQAKKAIKKSEDKGSHTLSNRTIEDKASEVITSAVKIINAEKGEVQISNNNGTSLGTIRILDMPETSKCRVVVEEKGDDTFLWEPGLVNGEHAVVINANHPFYYKAYSKIKDTSVASAFDLLLWSFVEAEYSTYTQEVRDQYKDMRYQTSSKLKKLINSMPDLDIFGDNNE